MEQNRNMEQAGTNAAVPTEKKNENRKREVSGKDAQIIRAFLKSVGIYEADALRVSIAIADGKVTVENISSDDRLALNRYLNSGTDNDRLTADNAQEHRLNRTFRLLERVSEFCDKQQLVTVNRALLSVAVNAEDISRAVSNLAKRPASVQTTGKQWAHWNRQVTVCKRRNGIWPVFIPTLFSSLLSRQEQIRVLYEQPLSFYPIHGYGKMKPCSEQRESRQVFPYRYLHGFILFQATVTSHL